MLFGEVALLAMNAYKVSHGAEAHPSMDHVQNIGKDCALPFTFKVEISVYQTGFQPTRYLELFHTHNTPH